MYVVASYPGPFGLVSTVRTCALLVRKLLQQVKWQTFGERLAVVSKVFLILWIYLSSSHPWLSVPSIRLVSVYDVSLIWYLPCSETLRSTVEVSPSEPGVSWSAVWCRCVLVQFGHSLALHVAVGPPIPVRILPWTCHTPSGEDATPFLCVVWLLFPTKTEFFVWYCSRFWVQCLFQASKEAKR